MESHPGPAAELIDFLLSRVDEAGLARLVEHEPTRLSAAYVETDAARVETRVLRFTGCRTCTRIPRGTLFPSFNHINVVAWPCRTVRSLALPFAADPDYREEWRPAYAASASGNLVHEEGDLR